MKFRRTFKVETVQNMGSDEMIARAAGIDFDTLTEATDTRDQKDEQE